LKVLDLRAPDPDGGHLPFALRVGESEAGQTCATVGQVDGSDFGLVGQDGRFRELAAGIVDGCGDRVADAAAVVGARVLDAPRWEDVRTVLYGTGGDDVASAVVIARGRESPVKLKDGAFVFAVRGYPEDTALDLRLRFRDGHTAEHSYAAGRDILLEQDAPAWRAEMSLMDLHPGVRPLRQCITVADARPAPSGATAVPPLCVDTRDVHNQPPLPVHPWRFAARTFVPGDHGQTVDPVGTWTWRRPSGRTMVWGYALPQAVSEVVVRSPGTRSVIRPRLGGAVAVVLPPSTAPSDIRITIIRSGGGQVLLRGSDLKLGSGS